MVYVFFAISILLLIKGGDLFVDGSIHLAQRTGIPRILIGSTIVSFATTMPELVASVVASVENSPEIAIGNAIGSVIANIGLIVGLTAAIKSIKVEAVAFNYRAGTMVALGLLLAIFFKSGNLPSWVGIILIISGLFYIFGELKRGMKNKNNKNDSMVTEALPSWGANIAIFILGALMIVVGSRLLVSSSMKIAHQLGVPPLFIGLTIVAVGTSLPEFVTAIISIKKGVADLSLGNIIGANILCMSFISGTAIVIKPFKLGSSGDIYSLLAMLFFVVLFFIMGRTGGKITRKEGLFLLGSYFTYVLTAYLVSI